MAREDARYVNDFKLHPVDRMARRVTSGGVHFDHTVNNPCPMWDAPPPTVSVTGAGEKNNPNFVDFTGRRLGRLVVVGKLPREENDRTAGWLVRCDCGMYTRRQASALKNPLFKGECGRCENMRKLRRWDEFQRTGRWPDSNG